MTRTCDLATDFHVGPIESGIGGRGGEYLVDACLACGYEWPISWLAPERRLATQRALDAKARKAGKP